MKKSRPLIKYQQNKTSNLILDQVHDQKFVEV